MPDTLDYMIAGYVIGVGLTLLTAGSVWWRYRSLKADEAALETLEKEVAQDQAKVRSTDLKGARVNN